MSKDPYAALGVKKTASAEEIKKAYKKLVRTSHPDLNPDDPAAESRFKAASAAYNLLKDPETRARFDRGEIDASGAEKVERPFYRDYAGAQNRGFGGQPGAAEAGFDPANIFADFLRSRGGFRGFGGAAGAQKGADIRYTLELDFVDAARGAKRRISLPDGRRLEVTIPPGSTDGQVLRLREKGAPGPGGLTPGDALIGIKVRPHPDFRRDGDDIHSVVAIGLDEAILGSKVPVKTLGGTVNLTVPKGANSGRVLRLRGRGIQAKGGSAGDHLVELRIVLPKHIDPDLENFISRWRRDHGYDPRGEA